MMAAICILHNEENRRNREVDLDDNHSYLELLIMANVPLTPTWRRSQNVA